MVLVLKIKNAYLAFLTKEIVLAVLLPHNHGPFAEIIKEFRIL